MSGGDANKGDSDRPTVVPAFDVEAFARDDAEASEVRVRPVAFPESFPEREPFPAEPCSTLIRRTLGPPESVPCLVLTTAETIARVSDPKSAFVVGFIDGLLPIDVLVEAIGMRAPDVVAIIETLIADGLVVLKEPPNV